jgi:hypothetical protein
MTVETERELWKPWAVLPDAGFEVLDLHEQGVVALRQVNATDFDVETPFRFRSQTVEDRIVRHLNKVHAFENDEQRHDAFQAAAHYEPADGPTDLASIPQFMRWLVNSYGNHTLAAIIHDKLIVNTPNGGQLKSDVVSDRFFREMLEVCGIPFLIRWVVWTGVALRTRWAAGTSKRLKVLIWAVLSVIGMTGAIWLAATDHYLAALGFGLGCLLMAAGLWGRQWGAAVVAAVALPLVVPVAVPALAATGVFVALDKLRK